uniref:tRNA (Guanine-N(7)-)-methyltransferase subunit WDR4 n=1 Tax=Lygus hesperus TaxID=30085 RepID=A0A146L8Q5_LYGHE
MASLAVSSSFLTISFRDKVFILKRSSPNQLDEVSVFPVEDAKSLQGTPITDGYIPMVCSSFSPSGKYFAACTNKTLTLWDVSSWTRLASSDLARAASSIAFSSSEDMIVIADKSGDAYLFRVEDLPSKLESSLLLGHVSMLLKIVISHDDKYVLTCDRDEKIRVSRFPNAYNVQTYCLGHEDSVTCLNFPKSFPHLLVSGSSDGTVRLWNYSTGELLHTKDCALNEKSLIVDLVSFPVTPTSFVVCFIMNSYNHLRVLSIDVSDTLKCNFLDEVTIPCSSPRALLSNVDELFVLSYDSPHFIVALKFVNNTFALCAELNEKLKDVTRKFNDDFLNITDQQPDDKLLSHLNKRKIDDTQDYYKRKNERLLANSK